MQKITPFLWFDNNAEEAVNFYVSVFKDGKIINMKRYPDGPLEGPMKGMEGRVLTAVFEIQGQRFMALDGGPLFKFNESISFLVDCKDQTEIDYFWDKFISSGGQESQCGWLKDKFGVSWQIVPDMTQFFNETDPVKSGRAMQAMLSMKKLDIQALQDAYDGK